MFGFALKHPLKRLRICTTSYHFSPLTEIQEIPSFRRNHCANRKVYLSTSTKAPYTFDENGEASGSVEELIDFPSVGRNNSKHEKENVPILLNSKEHAIGYLNRILNARVYEAAIETELQHAQNLSTVRLEDLMAWFLFCDSSLISVAFLKAFEQQHIS